MVRYKSLSGCKEASRYRYGSWSTYIGNPKIDLFPNAGLWLVGSVVALTIYAASHPKRRRY